MEFGIAPINWLAMAKTHPISQTLMAASLIWFATGTPRLQAEGTPIGMAVANGSFLVDQSRVWGNTTLFDGSMIETATAASDLQLNGGVMMRLASESRARVYRDRLVLES